MLKAGKMQEIADTLDACRMDITALQEVRWRGSGAIHKRSYTFYYSGGERQSLYGTGFLLSKTISKAVLAFEPATDRICTLHIKGKYTNLTIINAYAPTEDAEDEITENFRHLTKGM